jgi:hypothetical protein
MQSLDGCTIRALAVRLAIRFPIRTHLGFDSDVSECAVKVAFLIFRGARPPEESLATDSWHKVVCRSEYPHGRRHNTSIIHSCSGRTDISRAKEASVTLSKLSLEQ